MFLNLFAVSPINFEINVSKTTLYSGSFNSEARMFAVSVFPVPGAPTNRILFLG
ncbi:hypothetical protein D3C71_1841790 [compost metagenome]